MFGITVMIGIVMGCFLVKIPIQVMFFLLREGGHCNGANTEMTWHPGISTLTLVSCDRVRRLYAKLEISLATQVI